ncbi:MAG: transcription termination/antitermination protein NusA, partial [Azospirillum sp.]|nr:transcription termination/antitermination protein NusA [Azospirillum sp.]
TKVEEVALVDVDELAGIEGFDDGVAGELKSRAEAFVEKERARLETERKKLGVSDDIAAFEEITPALLVKLGEKGVKTLDDFADLAGDELVEIVGKDEMSEETANALIMKAREHWFAGEEKK